MRDIIWPHSPVTPAREGTQIPFAARLCTAGPSAEGAADHMSMASATYETASWQGGSDELPPGTELLSGQYRIETFIAAGGFGMTYRALDSLDRPVVIKECFPSAFCKRTHLLVQARSRQHQEEFEGIVRLFVQEAKSLAKLRHPNIVGVHQVFQENDTAYMALDFVDGRDLLDILEEDPKSLPPQRIEAILRDMLGAIGFVHGEGMLHRDISPDNVLMKPDGTPVLIDFGAARQQAQKQSRVLSALRVVKDGYSPQEFYVTGAEQGAFSDLYALGASFYHLIAGEAPPDSQQRLAARATGQADPVVPLAGRFPAYPDRVLESIDAALSVLPAERPQCAQDWLRAIDGDDAALPALGRVRSRVKTRARTGPLGPIPEPRRRKSKGRGRLVSGVAFTGLLIAGAAGTVMMNDRGLPMLAGLEVAGLELPLVGALGTPAAEADPKLPDADAKMAGKSEPEVEPEGGPVEIAAAPAAEAPEDSVAGARAFERRVAAAAAAYTPMPRPEVEGDPRPAEANRVAMALAAEMGVADARRRELAAARKSWAKNVIASRHDPRPAEAARVAYEVALADHKLRREALLHTVRPKARPAPGIEPPSTPVSREEPVLASNLRIQPNPPARLTTREPVTVALAPNEPSTDWGFADTVAPIVAPIFAAPAPPPPMPGLTRGWSVALPFGDLRADAGGNVMIRSLDGQEVRDLAAFERVLAERYERGTGDTVEMRVGIGKPGAPAAIQQTLNLPVVTDIALEAGPRFRIAREGDEWITRVTAVPDPERTDLQPGDVLLGEVSSGARMDAEDALERLLKRSIDGGAESLSFAVRRNGADWVATLALPLDD